MPLSWISRFASRRVATVLGLALLLPSLALGYFADDYILLHDLTLGGGGAAAAARLYRFSLAWTPPATGILPWFASPSYRTDFLRPLGGLLFWLDTRLWPGGGALAHLHSLGWWLLVMVTAGALLFRWLPPKVAALALLIFAVDDCHWQPVAWLANRHAAVAVGCVFAGIWAHLRWRDDGWRAGLPLSLLAYAVGLSAGESALQALAYLFADELFGSGRVRGRLLRLVPCSALVLTYGAVRHSLGAGVEGSGQYFDPATHPIGFLTALPARLAILIGDVYGGMPSDFLAVWPRAAVVFVVVGAAVSLVGAGLAWRRLRVLPESEARVLRGLTIGGFLTLLPGAAGPPGSRLLLAPSLASAALVATIILSLPSARLARIWLIAVHLLMAPCALVVDQAQAIVTARRMERMVAASDLDGDVVVVTTPDAFVAIYPAYLERASARSRLDTFRVLSLAPIDVVLSRTAADELRLRAVGGGRFLASPQEQLLRDRPLVPGEIVEQPGLVARVISSSEVSFRFTPSVAGRHFVRWHDGALRTLELPPPGQSVTIPLERGMMGL